MKKFISLAIALAMLLTLAACGAGGARRAAVVGIRLDLEGVSDDNIAAVIYGGGSVLSALQSRLAGTYGDTVAFDLWYSQPDESGGREYVLFGEASGGRVNDTITLPVDINGAITPENLAQVVDALLGQITAQLGEWGYKAQTTATTGTVTGTTQAISTGETSTEDWTRSAMARTSDTNISGPTTVKPTGYTPPEQYVIGGNLSRDRVAPNILEDTNVNSGKVLLINAPNGDFLVERKPYGGNFKEEGLTLYIYYDPEKDGSYAYVGSVNSKQIPTSDGQIYIGICFNPNQQVYSTYVPSLGKNTNVIDGTYWFTLSPKNYTANGIATIKGPINRSEFPIFRFDGTSFN